MKKYDRIIVKLFLFTLPLAMLLGFIITQMNMNDFAPGSGRDWFNSFSGLVFAIWMLQTLYISARLILSNSFRDSILPRLAFFKERDEREALITGQAARHSFLTTLALLIFFLCLSLFQVAVYKLPPEQAVAGKTGTLTLGVNMDLLAQGQSAAHSSAGVDYFRYSGLPLSNTGIILMLIFWQLASYNYFAKRLNLQS